MNEYDCRVQIHGALTDSAQLATAGGGSCDLHVIQLRVHINNGERGFNLTHLAENPAQRGLRLNFCQLCTAGIIFLHTHAARHLSLANPRDQIKHLIVLIPDTRIWTHARNGAGAHIHWRKGRESTQGVEFTHKPAAHSGVAHLSSAPFVREITLRIRISHMCIFQCGCPVPFHLAERATYLVRFSEDNSVNDLFFC